MTTVDTAGRSGLGSSGWWESDEGNNLTWVRFRLDRSSGANPSVVVLGTSACEPAIICAQFKGNPG
ncbi:MAG TPA: hypothetical protein VK894_05880 [Jiangellales bacterium]|nr:hypothetical protein [Jiangellales bacterium]